MCILISVLYIHTCTGINKYETMTIQGSLGHQWLEPQCRLVTMDWMGPIYWNPKKSRGRNPVKTMIYIWFPADFPKPSPFFLVTMDSSWWQTYGESWDGSTFGKFSPCRPRKLWKKFTWVQNAELAWASFMTAVIAEVVVGRTHFENKRSEEMLLLYMHIVLLAF